MRQTGSCLPRVAAKRTDEGFILTSTRALTSKGRIETVIGGIWIAVLVIVVTSQLKPVRYVTVPAIVILLIVVAARFVKRSQTYGKTTMRLSRWPIRLNESLVIGYRVLLKKRADIVIRGTVVCSEEIGSGDSTKQKEFFTDPLNVVSMMNQVNEVEASWKVRLPRNMPPSFETRPAKIAWSLHISVESSQSRITEEFDLLVVPEVVP